MAQFIRLRSNYGFPFFVISAGLRAIILEALYALFEEKNVNFPLELVFSNTLNFNDQGKIIGHRASPITSVTKSLLCFNEDQQRRFEGTEAAFIIGDVVDDAKMIPSKMLKKSFKIGILNNLERVIFYEQQDRKMLPVFQSHFDLVLANDPNFTSINEIVKSLYNGERGSEKVEPQVEELIDKILK